MKQAITRLVVLVILLVNQTLIVFGWSPLPFSEEQIFEGISAVALIAVTLWNHWKNNSYTKEAQEADVILKEMKGVQKSGD